MQQFFSRVVTRFALRVSSAPEPDKVFASLTSLLKSINDHQDDKGITLDLDLEGSKFIIFSDQHKGAGDLADDFHPAEANYQLALKYYYDNGYSFINLGDCEELWECKPQVVVDYNKSTLLEEAGFLGDARYYRIFGNHDLEWKYAIQQNLYLKPVFGDPLRIYEGIVLRIPYNELIYSVFLTHGHQGDAKSDGNAFSKWVVAAIWTPIQRYLEISLNSLSDSFGLVDRHNIIMSDWSATQKNLVFISGHTHKPVFASLDHIDRLKKEKAKAESMGDKVKAKNVQLELDRKMIEYQGKYSEKKRPHPSYFNTGCCCFPDGDISGIEIEGGCIRLIKWEGKNGAPGKRLVLEESTLSYLFENL